MRAVVADLLGAGTEGGHRDDDRGLGAQVVGGVEAGGDRAVVGLQADLAGDRRGAGEEEGELELQVGVRGLEVLLHAGQHGAQVVDV